MGTINVESFLGFGLCLATLTVFVAIAFFTNCCGQWKNNTKNSTNQIGE